MRRKLIGWSHAYLLSEANRFRWIFRQISVSQFEGTAERIVSQNEYEKWTVCLHSLWLRIKLLTSTASKRIQREPKKLRTLKFIWDAIISWFPFAPSNIRSGVELAASLYYVEKVLCNRPKKNNQFRCFECFLPFFPSRFLFRMNCCSFDMNIHLLRIGQWICVSRQVELQRSHSIVSQLHFIAMIYCIICAIATLRRNLPGPIKRFKDFGFIFIVRKLYFNAFRYIPIGVQSSQQCTALYDQWKAKLVK